MIKTEREKTRFLGKSTFDEAAYYSGSVFTIGGDDRGPVPGFSREYGIQKHFQRHDENLIEDAWSVLRRNYKIDLSGIEVVVSHGVIELLGSVSLMSQRHEAESILEKIPGVLGVVNKLKVSQHR